MATNNRILVLSQRRLNATPARCVGFEFEDVIGSLERTDVIAPQPTVFSALSSPLTNRVAEHMTRATGRRLPLAQRLKRYGVDDEYDLFFTLVQFPTDLYSLQAVRSWRDHVRKAVCVIEEFWARDVARWRALPSLLRGFDHVFLECSGSVEAVEERTGIPCSYLPPGVDALRFCPYPASPPRVIDVCHIGRRADITHRPLFEASRRGEIYYEYDSIRPEHVWDPIEHREHLAAMLKRTRYVLVNPGKFNRFRETANQQELGFRFFEGAAAGTVMLGRPPAVAAYQENFDWPDAVVTIDEAAVLEAIRRLDEDPAYVDALRRANVSNALARHDWVYRWELVLDSVGLPHPQAMEARKGELAARVALVSATPTYNDAAAR